MIQSLELNHIYGSSMCNQVKGALFYCMTQTFSTSQSIAFLAGNYLAFKSRIDIEKGQLQFIHFQNLTNLTRIIVNKQKNKAIFQEKGALRLVNLMKKSGNSQQKIIKSSRLNDKNLKLINFIQQQIICLVVQGQQELILMNIKQKPKIVTIKEIKGICQANSIKISSSKGIFSICGENFLFAFKFDQEFKLIENLYEKMPKSRKILQHCWLQSKMSKFVLVLTDKRQFIIINMKGTVKTIIENAFAQPLQNIFSLNSTNSKLILTTKQGHLFFWKNNSNMDQTSQQNFIEFQRSVYIGQQRYGNIAAIDIDNQQRQILLGLSNNDICVVQIPYSVQAQVKFQYLYKGSHYGPIRNIMQGLHMPLIITNSNTDNSVRIWQYKRGQCRLLRMFSYKFKQILSQKKEGKSIIGSVDLHPLGMYLSVGLHQRIILYYILNNNFYQYKHINVKGNCVQLKFSNSGGLLASVILKSKYGFYCINIYNSYSRQLIYQSNNFNQAPVGLTWKADDQNFFFCCQNQLIKIIPYQDQVRQYKLGSNSQFIDMISIGHQFIICEKIKNSIKVSVNKLTQKGVIRQKQINSQYQIVSLTAYIYQISKYQLLLATKQGTLVILNNINQQSIEIAIKLTQLSLSKIMISKCNQYCIATSTEGLIFIMKIKNKKSAQDMIAKRQSNVDQYLDSISLFDRNQILQQKKQLQQLKYQIQILESKLIQTANDDRLKLSLQKAKIKQQITKEGQFWSQRYSEIKFIKQTIEVKNQTLIHQQQKSYLNSIKQLEQLYARKLKQQNVEKLNLMAQFQKQRIIMKNSVKAIKDQFQQKSQQIQLKFQSELTILKQELERSKRIILQVQLNQDEQIIKYQNKSEMQLNKAKNNFKALLDENVKYFQEKVSEHQYQRSKNKIVEQQFQKLKNEHRAAISKINILNKNVLNSTIKIDEKEVIQEQLQNLLIVKQNRLVQTEMQNQDLIKKRKITQFKLDQQSKLTAQKSKQLIQLTNNLKQLDSALISKTTQNSNLLTRLNVQNRNMDKLTKKLYETQNLHKHYCQIVDKFFQELGNIMHHPNAQRIGFKKISQLYNNFNYLTKKKIQKKNSYDQIVTNQLQYLQQKIQNIKKNASKALLSRQSEIQKKCKENAQLITDLNVIRKQKKHYMLRLDVKSKKLEDAHTQINKLTKAISSQLFKGFRSKTLYKPSIQPYQKSNKKFAQF